MTEPRLRVLIVDASDRGGIATYTDRLLDGLRGAGIDARLCAPAPRAQGSPALVRRLWGYEIAGMRRARLYRRRLVETAVGAFSFSRAVRRVRPDVINVHTNVTPRFDALLFRALRRLAPIVVTAHDAIPHEGGAGAFRRQARVWRACDAIVIHGTDVRPTVAEAVPGVLAQVVPVDLPVGHAAETRKARDRLGVGDGPVALLFGLLRPYKGLGLLADAWPEAVARVPGARLFVVGDTGGAVLSDLQRLRALPGVEVREGFVPEAEVDEWLATADVLVLPYLWGTHSAVLHRGLSAGVPALASPALREEAVRLEAGRVVPLEPTAWTEALVDMLGSPRRLPPRPSSTGEQTVGGMVGIFSDVHEARHPPHPSDHLRILHVVEHLLRCGNGIVHVAVDLACHQAGEGHTVAVAGGNGDFEALLGRHRVQHRFLRHGLGPFKRLRTLGDLRRSIRAFGPHVIHLHLPLPTLFARLLRGRRHFGIVATVHNEFERKAVLMGAADRVIAVSEWVAGAMVRRRVPRDRVRIVLNGPLRSPRGEMGPGAGDPGTGPAQLEHPAVVTVAGLYRRKGVDVLIDAFVQLGASHPAAHLYIIGRGPEQAALEARAARTGASARIHFEGLQPDPGHYLVQAEVFVLASRQEPFGLAVVEAREAGCAVVVTDAGGLPEAVDHGAAGLVVPAEDAPALAAAIDGLLSDPDRLAHWRERARGGLERFEVPRAAAETMAVYRELF